MWVELTDSNGNAVAVNTRNVLTFKPWIGDGGVRGTLLKLSNDLDIKVADKYEFLAGLLVSSAARKQQAPNMVVSG